MSDPLELMNAFVRDAVPYNKALGIELTSVSSSPPVLYARLPWHEQLIGNPDTGVIHGGAITSLLDAVSGASLYLVLETPVPVATLDLRIDYLKPATSKADIRCRAECLKTTRNVGFVRTIAFQDDENDPIAIATSTFIISDRKQP